MRTWTLRAGCLIALCGLAASFCLGGPASRGESQDGASQDGSGQRDVADKAADPEQQLRDRILEAAQGYRGFDRVDDEARWAPYLCRMPNPSSPRFSASDDTGTHGGQKLYSIFAKDRRAYASLGREARSDESQQCIASRDGQVIVKESWVPKEMDGPVPVTKERVWRQERVDALEKYLTDGTRGTYPFAQYDGKTFYASEQAGLFLMLRANADNAYETAHSVNGWIFATTSPDGKEITALGKIESCAGCHRDAPHDGLFGIPGEFERY